MNHLKRKEFLKKVMLLAVGATLLPEFSTARPVMWQSKPGDEDTGTECAEDVLRQFAIIDLHCHPSLKMYLLGQHLWAHHFPSPGGNELAMQDDIERLSRGYVRGMVTTHYLVEASTEIKWDLLRYLFPWIRIISRGFSDKFEHEDYSNFTQINIMIDTLVKQIHIANQKQNKIEFVIARSFAEFEQAMKDGKLPTAHAIEDAHALGRNFPISPERKNKLTFEKNEMAPGGLNDPTLYIRNLQALKDRGVCLIILVHFFENDLVFPVEGISPDSKKFLGMQWRYTPDMDFPLKPIGKAVVQKMLEIGMIVDLTHSTLAARQDVFEIARQFNEERIKEGKPIRPLMFSHTGARQYLINMTGESMPIINIMQ